MMRVKFTDVDGRAYWLHRGRLVHHIDNATLYAHPSAARKALDKFASKFPMSGWSVQIRPLERRFRG